MSVCRDNYTKPINTKCGVAVCNSDGTYSYHWASKGKVFRSSATVGVAKRSGLSVSYSEEPGFEFSTMGFNYFLLTSCPYFP
jgi:hypothetical protein